MFSQLVAPKAASGSVSATSNNGSHQQEPPQGFPSSRRILKRANFQTIYQTGNRIGSRLFTVFARDTKSKVLGRIGFTATGKIGNAVERNRCKRLLREAIRKHWNLLPDGTEIILHARQGLKTAQASEVENEIVRVLRKTVH